MAVSSGLQNQGNSNYQLNWQSPKSYAGSCKTLHLNVHDGVTHDARFQFTKVGPRYGIRPSASHGPAKYRSRASRHSGDGGYAMAKVVRTPRATSSTSLRRTPRERPRSLRAFLCHQRAHLVARTATIRLRATAIDRWRSTLAGMWQQVKDRWTGLQDGQRAALIVALTAVIFLLYVTRRTYLR